MLPHEALIIKYDSGQQKSGMAQHKPYNSKKGIGFGAFAGFVGAVTFTGIILALPLILGMPTGIFMHALGLLIVSGADDSALVGMAAFSVILIQGLSIGIIFGIITSRNPRLHPSRRGKGVAMGLVTGVTAYFVIYLPMILFVFPQLLSDAVATYPEEKLSLFGLPDYELTTTWSAYLASALGLGFIAYLGYGATMGGIMTLEYSIYHFVAARKEEQEAVHA